MHLGFVPLILVFLQEMPVNAYYRLETENTAPRVFE